MADTGESYRERIVARLKHRFTTVVAGLPAEDPYLVQWSGALGEVVRAPITDALRGRGNVLAVLEQRETKQELLEQYEPSLEVALEFGVPVPKDVEPATHANRVLAELQRRIYEDVYLTDDDGDALSLDLVDAGSNIDVEMYTQRRVEGAMFIRVLYRHGRRDPRRYV